MGTGTQVCGGPRAYRGGMAVSSTDSRRAPSAVALLTLAWLAAVLALLWWLIGIGLESWADTNSDQASRVAQRQREGAYATLLLAGVALGGLLTIAVIAFAGRLSKTGVVYLGLAILLGVILCPAAGAAYREIYPPPPPSTPAPGGCQEYSGGEARCPGG